MFLAVTHLEQSDDLAPFAQALASSRYSAMQGLLHGWQRVFPRSLPLPLGLDGLGCRKTHPGPCRPGHVVKLRPGTLALGLLSKR